MRFSVAVKMMVAFILIAIVSSVAGFVAIPSIQGLKSQYETGMRMQQAEAKANAAVSAVLGQMAAARGYLIYRNTATSEEFNQAEREAKQYLRELIEILEEGDASRTKALRLQELSRQYSDVATRGFGLVDLGQNAQAQQVFTDEGLPLVTEMKQLGKDLVQELQDRASKEAGQASDRAAQPIRLVQILSVAALLVAVLFSLFFARSITGPVRALAAAARTLSAGDLQVQLPRYRWQDEVGDLTHAFQMMVGSLRGMVTNLAQSSQELTASSEALSAGAEQVTQAAQEITSGTQVAATASENQTRKSQEASQAMEQLRSAIEQVAAGAQEQARVVSTTAENLNAMAGSIREMVEAIRQVSQTSEQAVMAAQRGGEAVQQSVASMDSIAAAVNRSAERIEALGRRSHQIGEIINVITTIADQTNLLALNAAIEAARAGEHGRGFAVVAEEVRTLAERARKSTGEIEQLVKGIQEDMAATLEVNQEATVQASLGAERSSHAGEALRQILAAMEETAAQIQSLSGAVTTLDKLTDTAEAAMANLSSVTEQTTAAAEEMAAGSEEVRQLVIDLARLAQEVSAATEQMTASTEEVSATMEEMTASSLSLARMAQALQDQVSRFKV